jgi:sulfite exporter TauE/SafE
MSSGLTLGAALLLGLVASGHCLVMCGGISMALGVATAKDRNGRPRAALLVGYQLGRISSYALAGLLFAGVLGAAIAVLDIEAVRRALRALSAFALLLGALVAFGYARDPGTSLGRRVWTKLAPLGRRLVPVTSLPRAFAFGLIWGWMPCGFVYTVLLIAALQLNPVYGALTMAAFGLGTAPALLLTAFGTQRLMEFAAKTRTRQAAGSLLAVSALLTLVGPWVVHMLPGIHGWLPFDCGVHH